MPRGEELRTQELRTIAHSFTRTRSNGMPMPVPVPETFKRDSVNVPAQARPLLQNLDECIVTAVILEKLHLSIDGLRLL